jgi:hypothetical protein
LGIEPFNNITNAVVLMNAYLGTRLFDTRDQRHALLGISHIAIDQGRE